MSFLESLKKAFVYTGNDDDNQESNNTPEENKNNIQKCRTDIGNPIKRMKDIKTEAMSYIRESTKISKPVVTEYTKSLIYQGLHNEVEKRIGKNKPFVEAKMLYRRFLEDKVTDEALYSDEDLEYVKVLVSYIKELRFALSVDSNDLDNTIESIINNKYFLNIVEVLDIYYDKEFMKTFLDSSYIVCGCQYKNNESVLGYVKSIKTPYFPVVIGDTTFYLLNEVSTLINDESEEDYKRKYISLKFIPFFDRYIRLNNIDVRTLYPLSMIFKNVIEYEETHPTTSNASTKEVKSFSDNKPISTSNEKVIEEDNSAQSKLLKQKEVHEEMFKDLDKTTPIETLKKESRFLSKYSHLADGRNPNVSKEELRMAIVTIERLMFEEMYDLSPTEEEVYRTLKTRLRLMEG